MRRHTPGPWEFEPSAPGSDVYLVRPAGPTRTGTVAQVRHLSHVRRRAETVANAAVLAAAPELLEIVRLTHSYLGTLKAAGLIAGEPWQDAIRPLLEKIERSAP